MGETSRLTERIRAEYEAIPGLKLTLAQAARLWSAPEPECARAFDALVAERLLWLAPSGRYVALPSPRGGMTNGDIATARCPHCQKRNPLERESMNHDRDVAVSLRCVACHRVFTFSTVAA